MRDPHDPRTFPGDDAHYPASAVAAKHDASVARDTPEPDGAYAEWPGDYDLARLPWPPAEWPA